MQIINFPSQDILEFPNISTALEDPDGLLCTGGNLSVTTLTTAYNNGVFPWFEELPILWWSPYERAIIRTDNIHISKNMKKIIKQDKFKLKIDTCFEDIIKNCSKKMKNREETWIVADMQKAYIELFNNKIAHSFEVFDNDNNLVGGLYGVFVKNIFCGESMFSLQNNASKFALIKLSQFLATNNCKFIDCQMPTEHLKSMGSESIIRDYFKDILDDLKPNKILLNKKWNNLG